MAVGDTHILSNGDTVPGTGLYFEVTAASDNSTCVAPSTAQFQLWDDYRHMVIPSGYTIRTTGVVQVAELPPSQDRYVVQVATTSPYIFTPTGDHVYVIRAISRPPGATWSLSVKLGAFTSNIDEAIGVNILDSSNPVRLDWTSGQVYIALERMTE